MTVLLRVAIVILLMVVPLLSACSASVDDTTEDSQQPRQVSVRVYYTDSATPNVRVNLPLRAVTTAIRIASVARAFGVSIEIGGDDEHIVRLDAVDLESVRDALLAMEPGPILQVEEGGERVEIWID